MSWIYDFFAGPSNPNSRDPYVEARDSVRAQVNIAPEVLAAKKLYDPQYAALQSDLLQQLLLGMPATEDTVDSMGHTVPGHAAVRGVLDLLEKAISPAADRMAAASARAQREGDVTALEELGPRAVAAWKAANPDQAALLDKLNDSMMEDLSAGGALTPYEQRMLEQSIRNGQADRGMGYGPTDQFQEALGLALTTQGRKAALRDQAMRVAGVNATTTADPSMLIFGRPSTVTPLNGNALWGQAGQGLGKPQQFEPLNAYMSDLNNTNFNAEAATDIARFNMGGAITSAILGAGSKIGMGAAGCWVAREVFGEHNPKWRLFRSWLWSRGPWWLRWAYGRYGQGFALWIRNKPRLKRWVRAWMERKIEGGHHAV